MQGRCDRSSLPGTADRPLERASGRLQGHTDVPLDEIGRGQARALADAIADAGVTAIWTSDLARARQTGEIVAAALGLSAPALDPTSASVATASSRA